MKSNGKPDCGLLLFRSSGQLSWTFFKENVSEKIRRP